MIGSCAHTRVPGSNPLKPHPSLGLSTDERSGITNDPNRADDPQYIVRLVGQVVTVSVETVRLVKTLAAGVALPTPETAEVAAN